MKFTITHNNKEYLIDANSFSEARKKIIRYVVYTI